MRIPPFFSPSCRALMLVVGIAIAVSQAPSTAKASLILQYTFEDGLDPTSNSGTLGSARNGALQGNATFAPFGGGSQALSLDGGNANSVVIPGGSESAFDIGDSDFSLFSRFKTTFFDDSDSRLRGLIWKQNSGSNPDYELGVRQENGLGQFQLADGTQTVNVFSTTALNDGLSHELLGVRSGGQLLLYVDGVLEDTETIPIGFGSTNNNNALVIGGRTLGNTDDWNGLIDEIQVWNEAITLVPEPATASWGIGLLATALLAHRRRRG